MSCAEQPVPVTVPSRMPAVRVHEWGSAPSVDEIAVPAPEPGEVLVAVDAAVVSHLDATIAGGEFPIRPARPYVPGVEGSGRVVAVGRDVDPAAFADDAGGNGVQVRLYGAGIGVRRPGTWAKYVAVPATSVRRVPSGLDPLQAAAIGSSSLTAWSSLFDVGGFTPDQRLGVTGATGAVGSLVVSLARAAGGQLVRAFSRAAPQSDGVVEGQRFEPLVPGSDETDRVASLDLLVDTIGGAGLADRVHWVRPGGTVVLVGYTAGEKVTIDLPALFSADVRLLPVNMMRRSAAAAGIFDDLLGQAAAGSIKVPVEQIAFADIPAALGRLARGEHRGRLVATW